MRRLAFVVLALAAACGREVKGDPAPDDTFYKPTGLVMHEGHLIVASSNSDLRYVGNEGGTVIAVDPAVAVDRDKWRWLGGERISSFTGDLVVTPGGCDPLDARSYAFVASRYSNILYRLTVGTAGALSCDPATPCEIPLDGVGPVADAFAITAVCGYGRPRVFVAYLRSLEARGWVSEYDLATDVLRSAPLVTGPVRSFAYDPVHDRLWMAVLATGAPQPLAWVNLAGDCPIDVAASEGGCTVGAVPIQQMPAGLEVRGIAFANQAAPGQGPTVRRAYLTGRVYDVGAAAAAGGRTVDLGGLLVVADLVESAQGGVDLHVVRTIQIGHGAGEIRVLPARTGMRDVVAALAVDDGELWLYDDETLAVRRFGTNRTTGAPVLGHVPYAMAVDPAIRAGNTVRMYVASFQESFVTPVDVPLGDVNSACMLNERDVCACTENASGQCVRDDDAPARRISGGTR